MISQDFFYFQIENGKENKTEIRETAKDALVRISKDEIIYNVPWMNTLLHKYFNSEDSTFIVSGNIGDYIYNNIQMKQYLFEVLANVCHFKNVVTYNIVDGLEWLRYNNKNVEGNKKNNKESDEENYGKYGNGYNNEDESEKNDADISPSEEDRDPNYGLEKMAKMFRSAPEKGKTAASHTERTAFIITYPEMMLPNAGIGIASVNYDERFRMIMLHEALTSREYLSSSNLVIFVTESTKDMNEMFLSSNMKYSNVQVTLPDEKARRIFLDYKNKQGNIDFEHRYGISVSELARLTAGMSLMNIEDLLHAAKTNNKLTAQSVTDKKAEIIVKEYGDIIELYDTNNYSLDKFAGQDDIKNYFREVVINAIAEDDLSIVPKGVLLMGPPGTGKTYFSRCLAGDAGINFVEFKMSKIMDKWVGESEKKLEKAFSVFRALAPVGVFIDELDQALSRGNDCDNSVVSTIFGMFLAELSKPENRGKIIWLGATNYPNKIDEALKRSGRFDKKIPFFAPSEAERKAVFDIHLNKVKKSEIAIDENIDYNELVSRTDGYTQAEIENIVVKALELVKRRKDDTLTNEHLKSALDFMLTAQNGRIKEMEDIALIECNDLEFVPAKYRLRQQELLRQQQH